MVNKPGISLAHLTWWIPYKITKKDSAYPLKYNIY